MIRRRDLLKGTVALGLTSLMSPIAARSFSKDMPVLVVVELSGGNDGLNTVVPFADDAYYRHRPTIGIPESQVLKLDDQFGLNPGMSGFQKLWENNQLAIIHGCGYERPSYSHFTSMAYWHTGAPNGGDELQDEDVHRPHRDPFGKRRQANLDEPAQHALIFIADTARQSKVGRPPKGDDDHQNCAAVMSCGGSPSNPGHTKSTPVGVR